MHKPEITVVCCFEENGENLSQIILRSFGFFLQRELTQNGHKPASRKLSHG